MTDRYRVIVLREGETKGETLFELLGTAALLARLVPSALLDVLSADPDAQGAPDSESATAQDAADEAAGRPKRMRRTKAQIAADEEAKALGFRDAAHRTEVESAAAAVTPPPTDAAPMVSVASTPTETTAAPAAPYNPFG